MRHVIIGLGVWFLVSFAIAPFIGRYLRSLSGEE